MQRGRTGFEAQGEPAVALLARIIALYRANAADLSVGAAMLSRAAEKLQKFVSSRPQVVGRPLPVRRFLARAVSNARSGPLADVADAFALAEPAFAWLQNPNYSAQRMSPDFVDRYGYSELVGPKRAFESHKLLVGFLLLGPQTLYPDHGHAAEEVYHVVSGLASWRRDGEWRTQPPGLVIHHPPHVSHAMRTDDEPLLALYCWMGDITGPADLTKDERHG
jgi:mannose-6-phosphate isomerase-like protein (cupin superfamily)